MTDIVPQPLPEKKTEEPKKDDVDFGNPLDEEKALLTWKSPERLPKRRSREFFSTIGAFVFLLSVITVFFKEFLLMITIWAFAFLALVMSKTEPATVEHSLTTRGIKTGKNKYRWGELARFWFDDKWGKTVLHIDTWRAFPGRLMMILDETPKEKIKAILVKKIPYDKPEETFVDRAAKWLSEKVPLEEETMSKPSPRAQAEGKQEAITEKQTNISASMATPK